MFSSNITVVIPCYHMEAYIARSVWSVMRQTYSDWNIILVSDDGVDYTNILAKHGLLDDRITHTFTAGIGLGVSHARNMGVAAAQTRYVTILDADDTFIPERLEMLLPHAQMHGVVVTHLQRVDDVTGEELPTACLLKENKVLDAKSLAKLHINGSATCLFDRARVRVAWNETVTSLEDSLWNYQAMDATGEIFYHATPSYHYHIRRGSLAHSADTHPRFIANKRHILSLLEHKLIDSIEIREAALTFYRASLRTEEHLNAGCSLSFDAVLMEEMQWS
jgi:succinoglycan biosynthesis protein ExoO